MCSWTCCEQTFYYHGCRLPLNHVFFYILETLKQKDGVLCTEPEQLAKQNHNSSLIYRRHAQRAAFYRQRICYAHGTHDWARDWTTGLCNVVNTAFSLCVVVNVSKLHVVFIIVALSSLSGTNLPALYDIVSINRGFLSNGTDLFLLLSDNTEKFLDRNPNCIKKCFALFQYSDVPTVLQVATIGFKNASWCWFVQWKSLHIKQT